MWSLAASGEHRPKAFQKLDPELQSILNIALRPEPELRFRSCGDFREILSQYVIENQLHQDRQSLRTLMRETFAEEREVSTTNLAEMLAEAGEADADGFVGLTTTRLINFDLAEAETFVASQEPEAPRKTPVFGTALVLGLVTLIVLGLFTLLVESEAGQETAPIEPPPNGATLFQVHQEPIETPTPVVEPPPKIIPPKKVLPRPHKRPRPRHVKIAPRSKPKIPKTGSAVTKFTRLKKHCAKQACTINLGCGV